MASTRCGDRSGRSSSGCLRLLARPGTTPRSASAARSDLPDGPGERCGARLVGVALVVLAVWIGRLAVRSRDRTWLTVTGVGVVAIVLGIAGGTIFMGNTTSDGASFLMAAGCTIALGADALGLYPTTSAEANVSAARAQAL